MYETIKKQLPELFKLQNQLNDVVHEAWPSQHFKWYRAAMVEAIEAMEHTDWKWWKAQDTDHAQVSLELVDIFHFILSDRAQDSFNKGRSLDSDGTQIEFLASSYARRSVNEDPAQFLPSLERFIYGCSTGSIPVHHFWDMCAAVGLHWPVLRLLFLGKNALNLFRQENGYKTGTYVKIWDGREDNEHLFEIIMTKIEPCWMDAPADQTLTFLRALLSQRYVNEVTRAA